MTQPELHKKILDYLSRHGPATAKQIAQALSVDKREVNSALYGSLKTSLQQDSSYRWSLKTASLVTPGRAPQLADTPLGRLSRYYLDCLAHELPGVSTFAESRFDLDYEVIRYGAVFGGERDYGASQVVTKARQKRKLVYVGYPCYVKRGASKKTGWVGNFVQPVVLLPVIGPGADGQLSDLIVLNQKAMESITGGSPALVLQEIVELSRELGLGDSVPELDELARRLQMVRPEWPWQETVDPEALRRDAFTNRTSEGIYNAAVLIAADRSPYTVGLEAELSELATVPEGRYGGTALAYWLRPEGEATVAPGGGALVEPVPLNEEQRLAVCRALCERLTVITGPPGTGKSQVVTAILANAAHRGKTVLFASKNNKAVDVVERRVNALGSRPLLIRLGRAEHRTALSAFLASLLSTRPSAESRARYESAAGRLTSAEARSHVIRQRAEDLIRLRNEVDRLEQSIETARTTYGDDSFGIWLHSSPEHFTSDVAILSGAIRRARRESLGPFRLLWPLVRARRWKELGQVIERTEPTLAKLGVRTPLVPTSDSGVEQWLTVDVDVRDRFQAASAVWNYGRALEELTNAPSFESLARDERRVAQDRVDASKELWAEWLRLQPQRLSRERRRQLGEIQAALDLNMSEDDDRAASQQFKRLQKDLFGADAVLPCWAVSSLSARGRLPLAEGLFDLVVIDEASQCDIASALPLLFRAKRAVIIGDPMQLRHIAALRDRQDRALLVKHGLHETRIGWSYSRRSLFDLAASLVRTEDIVDLLDHHRSHADIIDFSNHAFYADRLRIATRYNRLRSPDPDKPSIRWMNVSGEVSRPGQGGAINDAEARAVLAELKRLLVEQGYEGTVGVVTPFAAQEKRIRDLALADPDVARKVTPDMIDTVHGFQGDERDVMLVSPVVSRDTPAGALHFLRGNANLFNVAVTRARAALVIVGDRAACGACQVDYLVRLVQHVSAIETKEALTAPDPKDLGRAYPRVSDPSLVSEWETLLYTALWDAGLRPVPQHRVEKFALDLALFDGDRKLDIEVDGERYHRQWDGELMRRDRIRNERLFELGWDVMRFWVYQVRDDIGSCVHRVKRWTESSTANESDSRGSATARHYPSASDR